MNVKLVIEKGVDAGVEFSLSSEVHRIGSGRAVDIRINGVSDHVATIVRRENAVHLFKRSQDSLQLGARKVQNGQEIVWPLNEKLHISGNTVIVLQPVQVHRAAGATPVKATWKKQNVIIWGAIGIAVAFMFVLSLPDKYDGLNRDPLSSQFAALIRDLSWSETAADAQLIALRELLQEARICEVRHNHAEAFSKYGLVRDILLRRNENGLFQDDSEQQVYEFVKLRLQQITP